MIENREYTINRSKLKNMANVAEILEAEFGPRILRWFICRVTDDEIQVEMTLDQTAHDPFPRQTVDTIFPGKRVILSVIPTGIGCSVGGYAADAAPVTALLASGGDYVVTNPNAVNASNFMFIDSNVLYTEGFIIDQFGQGLVNLYWPYSNRLGLIINKPEANELELVFNILNTVRAVHGIDIEHCVVTEESIGGCCVKNKSGSYVGSIKRPDVLFQACDTLIEKGVNAIAVTSNIKDLPMEDYAAHFEGKHPNPIGGAEAVISHLVCRRYRIPAAHAPLSNVKEFNLEHRVVDARGAGEFVSASGLACVLVGLRRAPQITVSKSYRIKDVVNIHNVAALVAPATALGGVPMLNAQRFGIPIIAVRDNETILQVTNSKLQLANVTEVGSYAEALGVIQAFKRGISLPSIYRPLKTLRF
jgi:hypothetical protein